MLMDALLKMRALLLRVGIYAQRSVPAVEAWETLMQIWPVGIKSELTRIGGPGDGGYLIPADSVDKIECVFSPGVSSVANFETFFARRRVPCFLADGTVEGPPEENQFFHFSKIMLGAVSDMENGVISLADWVQGSGHHSSEMLLQMDIEGAEYETLLAAPLELIGSFSVIVIEIHDLHSVLTKSGRRLIEALFLKLLANHTVVHLHVNNASPSIRIANLRFPDTLEVTFWRRDKVDPSGLPAVIPHPLDVPNTNRRDWSLNGPMRHG